ncbi:MAG: DUF971 domain-containing protein [Anaerolineae bacterium]|nr:DUF971 domain-containing protein [Anaerolineae bacterium]
MSKPTPTDISADRDKGELMVTWNDGQVCRYPFDLLRNACPCAQCRGGHQNMSMEPDEDVFVIPLMDANATRINNLSVVGNYALNIEWADGHNYGIYQWEYLMTLCQQIAEDSL